MNIFHPIASHVTDGVSCEAQDDHEHLTVQPKLEKVR